MRDNTSLQLRIDQHPQTLRELTTDRLRSAIINGYFKSGDRLVERTLCDQIGVSRTIVREVLRTLEAEGLVEFIAKQGPIVARMDWQQARQIYKVRRLLEADAARDCAAVADEQIKAKLKRALDSLGATYDSASAHELLQASTEFYHTIFQAAGHEISWEVVNRLNSRISRLRVMTLSTKNRHQSGFAWMTRIYEAIVSNDPDAAETAVKAHLTEACQIAQTRLSGARDERELSGNV